MGIYLLLVVQNIALHCVQGFGCVNVSVSHINELIMMGGIELVFEIAGIIKIYTRRK